jgi:hypothetical protein
MHADKLIPVFFPDQDTRVDEPLFCLPYWRCQRLRHLGHGRWINQVFRLKKVAEIVREQVGKPALPKIKVEGRDLRGTSTTVNEAVIEAYCDGQEWASEIVRSWRRDIALSRHSSSLKRIQTPVPKRSGARFASDQSTSVNVINTHMRCRTHQQSFAGASGRSDMATDASTG